MDDCFTFRMRVLNCHDYELSQIGSPFSRKFDSFGMVLVIQTIREMLFRVRTPRPSQSSKAKRVKFYFLSQAPSNPIIVSFCMRLASWGRSAGKPQQAQRRVWYSGCSLKKARSPYANSLLPRISSVLFLSQHSLSSTPPPLDQYHYETPTTIIAYC
jgi:hypothetical protein